MRKTARSRNKAQSQARGVQLVLIVTQGVKITKSTKQSVKWNSRINWKISLSESPFDDLNQERYHSLSSKRCYIRFNLVNKSLGHDNGQCFVRKLCVVEKASVEKARREPCSLSQAVRSALLASKQWHQASSGTKKAAFYVSPLGWVCSRMEVFREGL